MQWYWYVQESVSAKLRQFLFHFLFSKLLQKIKTNSQFDGLSSLAHKNITRSVLESIHTQFHGDF